MAEYVRPDFVSDSHIKVDHWARKVLKTPAPSEIPSVDKDGVRELLGLFEFVFHVYA